MIISHEKIPTNFFQKIIPKNDPYKVCYVWYRIFKNFKPNFNFKTLNSYLY